VKNAISASHFGKGKWKILDLKSVANLAKEKG